MLSLWSPYNDLWSRTQELASALDWAPAAAPPRPAVDVVEEEHRYVLSADLPGYEEKDIDVRVLDGVLVLSGKREQSRVAKGGTMAFAERRYGSFCRQFTLGSSVDESKIEATYKNGVLTVALPKREEAKPRQIPVHAS